MKLWVAVFVATVCALHLPGQGDAGQHLLKYQIIAKRGEKSRINVVITSLMTLIRKYPRANMEEVQGAVEKIVQSLPEEELESDHLEAIIIGKYGDGSYTEDDKEYFAAMFELLEKHDLRSIHMSITAKYPEDGGILFNAPGIVFPALTVNELKSPNILQIIEAKYVSFMNQEA